MSLLDCLDVPDPEALAALPGIIDSFIATIPSIINPLEFGPKIPQLPGSAVELFIQNLSPDIPSFSANILGVDISFKGRAIEQPEGLDFPIFDPEGLIKMITGLSQILIGLPDMFIELTDAGVFVPKFPTKEDLILLVAFQIGLVPNPNSLPAAEIEKFVTCLVEAIAVFIP